VIVENGVRHFRLMRWGLLPAWVKDPGKFTLLINARSETVFKSRAFAPAARRHRCLVPALGWYEWQGASAPRQPWIFHLDGFKPFAFAGIFCQAAGDEPGSFAILTTEAAADLAHIHGRMPVVLGEREQQLWLARESGEAEARAALDRQVTKFSTYKVSAYVNKPANNDAACIAPL